MNSGMYARLLVMTATLSMGPILLAQAAPPQAMCAMGPLKCADGTYVFPGPGCTFSPCPGKPPAAPDQGTKDGADSGQGMVEDGQATEPDDQGGIIIDRDHPADADATAPPLYVPQGTAGTAVTGPGRIVEPDKPSPGFPDYPLDDPPAGAMNVSFIFEHRTALNEKHVAVHGMIISTLLADKACPPGRGMCAQPRITLSDSADAKFKIEVLLPESDRTPYEQGQTVEISGTASSGPAAVVIRKE